MEKLLITWEEVFKALLPIDQPDNMVYGVPKGGMIAAGFLKKAKITHNPKWANIILDDLVDSGQTKEKYEQEYSFAQFVSLFNKQTDSRLKDKWIVFPWEAEHPQGEDNIQQNIVRQLQYIGEDVTREGLLQTPNRIVRAWDELFAGYKQDPSKLFTVFEADGCNQIVLLKDVELYSMCEHHMLPFFGKAHVAYIPNKKVIGISKLARLVDIYARRLQIQERIGEQVTEALMKYLQPLGAACVIESTHLCMRMRGVSKQQSTMVTSSMKGVFFTNTPARQELMNLIK